MYELQPWASEVNGSLSFVNLTGVGFVDNIAVTNRSYWVPRFRPSNKHTHSSLFRFQFNLEGDTSCLPSQRSNRPTLPFLLPPRPPNGGNGHSRVAFWVQSVDNDTETPFGHTHTGLDCYGAGPVYLKKPLPFWTLRPRADSRYKITQRLPRESSKFFKSDPNWGEVRLVEGTRP